ncbi:hypothetical protein CH274_13325 [Rhodococcus sp. 06-418-5]|uniref:hypothetical protein n=1 Tax=Rhodococcus sp. 06-418-5 TaxID=2022507 RepID=UPI000B9ABFDB|nr:hypothetical protein [Rhodococcus sp. 06-418-5]OZC80210.1 hypothetical protein CH274_13325 [Rhodococcus sp. 06-418-5]
MTPDEYDRIAALAALAREDTFRPGWPFGGTGEWTENLVGLLGGPVGDFVGAVSPDVVDGLIFALRDRDTTITRLQDAAKHVTDMTIHPEGTAGAATGFTTVTIPGRIDIITRTDFPVYRELEEAKGTIATVRAVLTEMAACAPIGSNGWFYAQKLRSALDQGEGRAHE